MHGKEVDEGEATIMMVDSNFQREEILLSEKARAYKKKLSESRLLTDDMILAQAMVDALLQIARESVGKWIIA